MKHKKTIWGLFKYSKSKNQKSKYGETYKNIWVKKRWNQPPLRILTWKITPAGGEKVRAGGGTVAQNDPCMVIRAQPKYSQ